MKKFLVLNLIFLMTCSDCYAWSFNWKKDKTPKGESMETVSEPVEVPEYDNYGSGYKGTLPDVSKNFGTSEPQSAKPTFEKSKKFNSAEEIKPVPRDNPAFVNIMLKTDKTSQYVNDINEIIPQLENILTCIENGYDVQKFNAKVHFFNQHIQYLQEKYEGKPECNFDSFQKLLTLSTHSQSIATLRSEAEKYRPYLAYTGAGYLYNDNVINQQLDYLRSEIEDTIVVLKDVR
ncbi:hypothetical protein J6P92_01465 [bacterium]|nr:hypothetical protein [bacterium]